MSAKSTKKRLFDESSSNFSTSILPLYHGDLVSIRIGSAGREYKLSKDLICEQSPYFAAMFSGDFKEAREQSATLQEIDGVVSERSFSSLVQWIYLGRVVLDSGSTPNQIISNLIEFARLADMCGINGIGLEIGKRIKAIIMATKPSTPIIRDPGINMDHITSENIVSASFLPDGHPVRSILAAASVEEFLRRWNGEYKFQKEAKEVPRFAFDLLTQLRLTLKTVVHVNRKVGFRDPISEKELFMCDLMVL